MCRWRLESALIPLFTVPSCILMVIAMSTKSWVIGHLRNNKQVVARISPWYLCANHCVTSGQSTMCTGSKVPALMGMDCFWMRDWSTSGFNSLTAVQHLEYWCLGSIILSLFPALISCLDRRSKLCPVSCKRPTTIFLLATVILSLLSVCVFGSTDWSAVDKLANGKSSYMVWCWPWHLRVLATVLTLFALLCSVIYECRTRNGEYVEPDEDDKVVIVPVHDEDDGDMPDYGDSV